MDLRWMRCEMDGSGSESCRIVVLGIRGAEYSGSATMLNREANCADAPLYKIKGTD
jgi:hypothetical protein